MLVWLFELQLKLLSWLSVMVCVAGALPLLISKTVTSICQLPVESRVNGFAAPLQACLQVAFVTTCK